ncbi:DUF1549 domain-containing protein [soil metagenome]
MEDVADPTELAVESCNRTLEFVGHRFKGESLVIPQLEDFPLIVGKLGETAAQNFLTLFEVIFGRFMFARDGVDEFIAEIEPVTLLAFPIGKHLMESHFPRPGGEIGSLLKLRKTPPHPHLCLLQNIVGILAVRHEGKDIGSQHALMSGKLEYKLFSGIWGGHVHKLKAVAMKFGQESHVQENDRWTLIGKNTLLMSPTPFHSFVMMRSLLCLVTGSLVAIQGPLQAADGVDFFEKRIRPLLVEHCYECHSADKKIKGGLRLDTQEGWKVGGDTGPAIQPSQPDKSLLIKAISYTDHDLQMPPKNKMAAADIEALRQWVTEGAIDPRTGDAPAVTQTKHKAPDVITGRQFWAFQLPKNVPVPAVQNKTWPRQTLDHFILSRLEKEKIQPAPDASLEVLSRRLYYDLIGLPPTPEELDQFVAAMASEAGYEQMVDKLLSSPHFGERWGRHWLDMVRFAESSGGGRSLPFKDAWRYRDYIIESLNADVPLDRLITEQLAGDLLPSHTSAEKRRNLIATGFLALGPTNYEEQDKHMLRMDIVDEQIETVGKAFLGMTIGCARCHDHKFDPIPTKDYYALAGIFRSTSTIQNYVDNVAHWIEAPLPLDGEAEQQMQARETKLAALKSSIETAKGNLKKLQPKPETLDKTSPIPPEKIRGIVVDDAQAKRVGDWKASTVYPTYIGEGYTHDRNESKGTCTLTFVPVIPKSGRYEVRFSYTALNNRAKNVPITIFHADGEATVHVDETETPPIDSRFVSLGQYRFEQNGEGYILLTNEGTKGYVTADAMVFIPVEELDSEEAKSGKKQKPELAKAEVLVKSLEKELKAFNASGEERPEAMSVQEGKEIEDCAIHIRGSIRSLGEVAPRGFLTVATNEQSLPISPKESGRRELAEWITSEKNPLTSRVLTNRIWMWLFGDGLVRTVDNFGITGELPSHPELLDTLARDFMSDGWSLKRTVKRYVMSRAYRMKSLSPSVADPDNRLLAHQSRRRLDAESIRDAMLMCSGTIDLQLGGSTAKAAAIDQNTDVAQNLEYNFVFTDSRRSVYTPAFRNKRLELFEAFDFADINQTIGKRNTSTIAPQALYFLNHPFVMEQSLKAAERLMQINASDEALITLAYRQTLGRMPTERERTLAQSFVQTSGADTPQVRQESWAQFIQCLFASVDFRYLN